MASGTPLGRQYSTVLICPAGRPSGATVPAGNPAPAKVSLLATTPTTTASSTSAANGMRATAMSTRIGSECGRRGPGAATTASPITAMTCSVAQIVSVNPITELTITQGSG